MKFNVIPSGKFQKEAKKLIRKFPSLKIELSELNEILQTSPASGTPLGNNIYKIRLAMKSKGKGKSGGSRIITYVINEDKEVYLLTIYDNSDLSNVDDKTIKMLIENLLK